MAKTYNRMRIDVNGDILSGVTAIEQDTQSRYLDVSLYNNGVPLDLTGEVVRIYVKKPDGTVSFEQGEITDAVNGRCQFELTNQMLAVAGDLQMQISVWSSDAEILSTKVFKIYVSNTIRIDEAIESTNEFGVLVVLFQEIQDALDTMKAIADGFGEPGEMAEGYGVNTFWEMLEVLAQRADVVGALDVAIKTYLNSTFGKAGSLSLDKMIIINSLLSDVPEQCDWAFRQPGIGDIINEAFNLNSDELASCNTVEEVAANAAAMDAICSSVQAIDICSKNEIIAEALDSEDVLAAGLGYLKYSIGDLVTLKYNGVDKRFRVTKKDYLTQGKITLVSEDILEKSTWNASNNNYETSALRSFLNGTVLSRFSAKIQNAMVVSPVPCHNKNTAVICNDKIWTLSHAEVGLETDQYAPVEGTKMDWFDSNDRRIKKLNGIADIWWLRTPSTHSNNAAWYVYKTGTADGDLGVIGSNGVVPVFEI